MIRTLLKKEWTLLVRSRFKAAGRNWSGILVDAVVGIALFAFILFIFNRLAVKFVNYGVADKLLTVTLGLVTVVYTVIGMIRIDRVVYGSADLQQTLSLPLRPRDVVVSKAVGLYLSQALSLAPLLLALFISYGFANRVGGLYAFAASASFVLLPCWVLFFATLLSWPYHYLKLFMANHSLVQLGLAIVAVALFSYIYGQVLTVFIDLINDGRLAYLFNDSNMTILSSVNAFLLPARFIVDIASGRGVALAVFFYVAGSLVALALSVFGLVIFYRWVKNHSFDLRQRRRRRKALITSPTAALFKKEVLTLFRNSNYLFVYCTLLLSLGFINYAIAGVLKPLVARFLGSAFPFFPFALLVLSVFAAVINGLGALVISKEKHNAVHMKIMPVSYKCQIKVKYGLLLLMAFVSLALAGIVLAVGGLVGPLDAVLLVATVFFLVAGLLTDIVGKDLRFPNFSKLASDDSKVNHSLVAALVIPVLVFLVAVLFFYVVGAFLMKLILPVLALLIFALFYYRLMRRVTPALLKMEVES